MSASAPGAVVPGAAEPVRPALDQTIAARVDRCDWPRVTTELDAQGWAMIDRLLTPPECRRIAGLYEADSEFRSKVVMARHGFGRGEYKYFA